MQQCAREMFCTNVAGDVLLVQYEPVCHTNISQHAEASEKGVGYRIGQAEAVSLQDCRHARVICWQKQKKYHFVIFYYMAV
jgi:hypothetical protein